MATVIPCIKGKMGNTEFFEAIMTAGELVARVRPASEHDDWASMSIEERMQRDPNVKRIREEIAPYVARSADRFFGAIIVLVYEGEVSFESLKDLGKLPNAYRSSADRIGFVTIDGGSLIVLDGQHRLLALEEVIKQRVEGEYAAQVPNDDITVILIKHETPAKTRRIFNKVNRYAKPTSRGDNIITSEDDAYAIISRRLLNDGGPFAIKDPDGELIVNWKSNTLSTRSLKLTTISVLYDTAKHILDSHDITSINPQKRPTDDEVVTYYDPVEHFWSTVLSELEPYRTALQDPRQIPSMREAESQNSLLFKPVAQIALVQGLILACKGERLTLKEAVARANKIDWRMASPMWRDIIVRASGTIDASADARSVASQLIAYLIAGDKMGEAEIADIKGACSRAKGKGAEQVQQDRGSEEEYELPVPVRGPLAREAMATAR